MKEDLLNIINNYGVMNQLEYYQTEVWELNEAIINYETAFDYSPTYLGENEYKNHITEELADNYVMLYQFKEYYNLDFELVKDFIKFDSDPLKFLKLFFKDVHKLGKEIIKIEMNERNESLTFSKEFALSGRLQIILYELKQFQAYYKITDEQIEKVMKYKVARQLERIKNEV